MRILMTTDTVGGVWSFTATLCAALCGAHDVALVSFGRELSAAQDGWVRGMHTVQDGFFEFHSSDAPLEWMPRNDGALAGAKLLERVAAEFEPDVLHANQFCWGALPRAGALDIARIVTAHSDVLSWAAACRPDGLEDSPWLRQYRGLVRQGLAGTDALVAPTQWMLDALGRNFTVPAGAHVIANGVTLYDTRPLPARKLQAVAAGRFWDEAKNLALLDEVDCAMPLYVAGETKSVAARRHLGFLDQGELHQLFRSSAVYVCPSVYEPFGLAPLEAALCGCALVLNDIASLREIWGEAALYFHGRSGLEALLRRLAEEPETILRTARSCSRRAGELTAASKASAYEELYRQAAAVHAAGGGVHAHA